jgi:hypothetical protein
MTTSIDVQGITITLKRIVGLLESEEEDEYGILKPSDYAFKTIINLVLEAHSLMGNSFPKASASTDHEGGISLDWAKVETDRQVSLFCPFSSEQKAYIYHQISDEYAVDYDVSLPNLAHWLRWFNGE